MPKYQFAVRHDDEQHDDVRWTHLPDEEAARRFAGLLVRELLSSKRYTDWSRSYLDIKDENGRLLVAIRFANQLSGLRGATHQKAQSGYRGRSSALRSEKRSERGYPKQRSLPSSGAPCRGVVWAIDSHQKTYPEMRYRFDHVLRRTLGGRQWPN